MTPTYQDIFTLESIQSKFLKRMLLSEQQMYFLESNCLDRGKNEIPQTEVMAEIYLEDP